MSDKISLLVNKTKIENFLSYTVEADLYTADDAFSLELANPEIEIKPGQQCELYCNDKLELTGIIDRVTRGYDKGGRKLKVEGRDLMGLLVDSHCEQFVTVQGKKIKDLADMLLKTVPFINRKDVVYQENFTGKLKGKKRTGDSPIAIFQDTPQKLSHIMPGMTVFDVLKTYAASRGMMFWLEYPQDGGVNFVFGRPKAAGEPLFNLTLNTSGVGVNVLDGEEVNDISKRFSKVKVIGQQQGFNIDGMNPKQINTKGESIDPDFPFYKPYVTKDNNDSQSPPLRARMLMEKQRHDGYQLHYRVPHHSQNGRNWMINELCQVKDDVLGIDKVFLIFGRTFERSKQNGTCTRLKLGPPGLIQ